jgi:hypothetical protein
MRYVVSLLLAVCLFSVDAHNVYRWVAPDGSIYYSDQPHPGADIITLPEWTQPLSPHEIRRPLSRPTVKPVFTIYNNLAITRPKAKETIRDNSGNVQITLAIAPELDVAENHKIQILLDGQKYGEPIDSLELLLTGIERGKHTVAARVVNERGRVLIKSRSVTFYLHHASPLFHPPRLGTPPVGVQQAPRAPMAPRAPRAPHVPFKPAAQPPPTPSQPPGR